MYLNFSNKLITMMVVSLPLPLPSFSPFLQGTLLRDELKGVYGLLLRVDRVMARYSPVILIQRWTRGWLTRRQLIKTNNPRIMYIIIITLVL